MKNKKYIYKLCILDLIDHLYMPSKYYSNEKKATEALRKMNKKLDKQGSYSYAVLYTIEVI